jgi:hypothetical protein
MGADERADQLLTYPTPRSRPATYGRATWLVSQLHAYGHAADMCGLAEYMRIGERGCLVGRGEDLGVGLSRRGGTGRGRAQRDQHSLAGIDVEEDRKQVVVYQRQRADVALRADRGVSA